MKKTLLTILFTVISLSMFAQIAQHRIFSDGRNEIATKVKILQNGDAIVGGYVYEIEQGTYVQKADMFLLRVNASGQILWQKQFGSTDVSKNDFLNSLTVANNGDIIAVGRLGRTSNYINNTAGVFRFSSSNGAIIWAKFLKDSAPNEGGTVFDDVTELDNGLIVAVGSNKFKPSYSSSMITILNGNGNILVSKVYDLKDSSDNFMGVCANGNSAIITGWFDDKDPNNNFKSSQIMSITPSLISGVSPTLNWHKYYRVSANINGRNLFGSGLSRVFVRGNKILAEGILMDGYGPNNGSTQLYFECDLQGNNAAFKALQTNYSFVNNTGFFPLDDKRFFAAQNPANTLEDAVYWINSPTFSDVVISDMQPWTSSIPTLSKRFAFNGNQGVFDMCEKGGLLYGVGAISGAPLTSNDIYYILSSHDMKSSNDECVLQDEDLKVIPATTYVPTPVFLNKIVNLEITHDIDIVESDFNSELLCGDPIITPDPQSPCDLQCYWRTDGNIINSANFLGTNNKDDIRFRVNGNQAAVLSWLRGNFGLNTPAPSARLHVVCDPEEEILSDIRFEKLGEGRGKVLVIDDDGYVYKSEGLEAKQAKTIDSLSNELAILKREVSTLVSNGKMNDVAEFIVAPNPTNGKFDIYYGGFNASSNINIVVVNMQGGILKKEPMNGTRKTVDISNVSNGSYRVLLEVNGQVVHSKQFSIVK